MLKKITQGKYEAVKTRVQTTAGGYVGTASTPENAQMFAASKQLTEYIHKKFGHDREVMAEVEAILKEAKG